VLQQEVTVEAEGIAAHALQSNGSESAPVKDMVDATTFSSMSSGSKHRSGFWKTVPRKCVARL
jgi:hypothetical protein